MFWPESAYGPTNQCIGLAAILRDRGHTIVFAAESSWAGKLAPFGFIEELVDLAEPAEGAGDEDAGAFWTEFIAETAPEFRKPTIEQLGSFIQPTYQALIDGAKYCEPRLREIIAKHRPDVIVEDNVVLFPALTTSGAPFVRIVSCSPLEVTGPDVPPPFSGLPSADRSQWDAYRAEFDRTHRAMWSDFNDWVQAQGADPLSESEFMPHTTAANLYVYPTEADYLDARPLDDTWARMDSSVRETDEEYQLPAELADRPEDSALVYFSLGSLGGADVALMQRVVDVLGTTRHRYIVSRGPQHDQYQLAGNMWGEEFLPQPAILPIVDLVITHGGNNTTTECFHHGKPMVAMPVFWDQYDNAQRVDETGFGVRLPTYTFAPGELRGAIDRLLADRPLRDRMATIARGLQADPGTVTAAGLIEHLAS